jgi:hypothetical protein
VHLETWECNPEAEYGTLGFVSPLVTSWQREVAQLLTNNQTSSLRK